jgi:hypothetical protein
MRRRVNRLVNNARGNWLKNTLDPVVFECIKYLDLDKEGPNRGTKNKQDLMIRILQYIAKWKEGMYVDWRSKIATRLGLTPRAVKENYLDPLIREGIVGRVGPNVFFMGVPQSESSEES